MTSTQKFCGLLKNKIFAAWSCKINSVYCYRQSSKQFSSTQKRDIYDYSVILDSNDRKICLAREKLGLKGPPVYVLRKSSAYMYESCTDHLDIVRYFDTFQLEDTFNSWFLITSFHVWMLASRCMSEPPKNGLKLRNELIKRMWEDVANRMKKLGHFSNKVGRFALTEFYHQFNSILFSLDESLLSDDTVLAGTLWRSIMSKNPNKIDAIQLEILVHYTRLQLQHLSTINSSQLALNGHVQWKKFPPLIV